MTNLIKKIQRGLSFSLVESAVVIAVAGSVIGGGLKAYQATNPKVKSDLKKMEAIEKSLQQFFTTNGRLPFPAHPTQGPSTANYLVEYRDSAYNATQEHYAHDNGAMTAGGNAQNKCIFTNTTACNPGDFVLWGVVPTRTLGLPDDYAYDSYGHNFEYVMHSAVGVSNETLFQSSTYKKSNYTPNASGQYTVLYPHTSNTSAKKQVLLTRLSVYNNSTAKQIPTTVNNTAYVLISKGDTGNCYFNAKGSLNTTKPTGNLLKNCVQNYGSGSTTERTIYQGYSKSFNNVVRYKTMTELISTASSVQEDTRNLGKETVRSQQRVDNSLQTSSKEVVGAINETNTGVVNLRNTIATLQDKITALETRLNAIQSTHDSSNKLFLMGATAQGTQPTTRSQGNVYMQTGTLYLTKRGYVGNTSDNPALIVGSLSNDDQRLEFYSNGINKKSENAPGTLYLNYNGGDVSISENANASLIIGKSGGTSKIYLNGKEFTPTVDKATICEMMYPVGSVYITTRTGNPRDRLGCGTWKAVPHAAYLQNGDTDGTVYAIISKERSGWRSDMIGKTTPACIPNLKGQVLRIQSERGQSNNDPTGVFTTYNWKGNSDQGSGSDRALNIYFDASKYNNPVINGSEVSSAAFSDGRGGINVGDFYTVYLDGCTTVHPYSFTVLMWYRRE